MGMVKILHCADIHIGALESFLGEDAAKRRYETLLTFEKIIDMAAKWEVQLVAIAGDLFDSNHIEESFVSAVSKKIREAQNIKFVFSAGNHDPLNSESPFLREDLPQNLFVLPAKDSEITLKDIGVRVYGRSFESVYCVGEEAFALNVPNDEFVNIMVQHGDLRSDLGSDYNSVTPKFIKNSGMDYIALGHTHERTEIGKLGGTHFAYCGCPEGHGFDELGCKGVYIGEVGKGVCKMQFVPTSIRQYINEKIDVSGEEDVFTLIIDTLKEKYSENYIENLYKITLVGKLLEAREIDISELSARLSSTVYFAKIKDLTELAVDLEGLAKEASLKGIFVKKMLEKMENEEDKTTIEKALYLGLKAFDSEVKYSED